MIKDYNVVNVSTDFSILQENLHKLKFINDVAIFYDKTRTYRNIFKKYSDFNIWLEEYCNINEIDYWQARKIIKPLVETVQKELLTDFNDSKSYEINLDEKEKILGLFLKNKTNYYDFMRLIWYHLPIENNLTLIHKDGTWLMSKNFMIVPIYFNNIQINEYGLFRCEEREYKFESGRYNSKKYDYDLDSIQTSRSIYFWDNEGHFLDEYEFKTFMKLMAIVKNDYKTLLNELNNSIFKVVGPQHNGWYTKNGQAQINWGVHRDDGLLFYSEENSRPGRDTYTNFEYVRDNFGNQMYLNDFFTGLKCLKNGSDYLDSLKSDFLKKEIEKFI